jgi:hypothetical protein
LIEAVRCTGAAEILDAVLRRVDLGGAGVEDDR